MRFSDDFVEQIRAKIPLVQYIGRFVPLRRAGSSMVGCCPFHQEKSPSFNVSDERGLYYCFGCGAKGDVFEFVMAREKLDFSAAIELLAKEAGLALPTTTAAQFGKDQQKTQHQDRLRGLLELACAWFARQLAEAAGANARAYLTNRGVSQQSIAGFELGFAPSNRNPLHGWLTTQGIALEDAVEVGLIGIKDGRYFDWFRDRIMFPIRDAKGQLCGFGGRVLQGSQVKYLNSPETPLFQKRHILYGMHQTKTAHKKSAGLGHLQQLVVVEGYLDVIALHQAGFANAVAPLGTAVAAEHIQQAFAITDHLTICLDGDAAGQRAAVRTLNLALPFLNENRQLDFVRLPVGDDPDSLLQRAGSASWARLQAGATPLEQAMVSLSAEGLDLAKPAARAQLRRHVQELLQLLPDGTLRQEYHHATTQQLAGWLAPYQQAPAKPLQNKTPAKNNKNRTNQPAPLTLHHLSPSQLPALKIAKMLRVLVDSPEIWPDVAEEVMLLPLNNPMLEQLRSTMADVLHQPLTAAQLQATLLSQGHDDALRFLQQPAISNLLIPYMQLASSDERQQRWQNDWHQLMVEMELQPIPTPHEFPDQEAWERFQKQRLAQEDRRNLLWQQDNV
jgi:DNA primase